MYVLFNYIIKSTDIFIHIKFAQKLSILDPDRKNENSR